MKKIYLLSLLCILPLIVLGQVFQTEKIVASDRAIDDQFGYSVSISEDYAIVGSARSNAAYIYEIDETGTWLEVQKLVSSDFTNGDVFGQEVSISGDYAVVSAHLEDEDELGGSTLANAGSAYIFERDDMGYWSEVQKIVASDRAVDDYFGSSVAISGDYLIVSATEEDEDASGMSTINLSGSAYVFERDGSGVWTEVQKIVASDRGTTGDRFGFSVMISNDYIVVGVPFEDEDASGMNTINGAGAAYVFERNGSGIWVEVQKLVASDRDVGNVLGESVSISGDYLIIGANSESEDASGMNTLNAAGAAYIFERNGSGVWVEAQKIVSDNREEFDLFGQSVSISGNYAIIGAHQEDEDALEGNTITHTGSVYLFERGGNGVWTLIQKIVASDRGIFDRFGRVVFMSGDNIIIGTPEDDDDASGANSMNLAGSAYIFNRYDVSYNSGEWSGGSGPFGEPTVADGSKSIIIADGSPALSAAAVVNNLTLTSGASLTIPSNGALTVNNELIVNDAQSLLIESDATGTGNVITNGDILYKSTGSAKVERFIHENGGSYLEPYHYIASPVDDHAIFNDMSALYAYRESDLTWMHYTDFYDGFSTFSNGTGYAISYSSETTKSFIGALNTGTYEVAVTSTENGGSTYQHFNLLGNPYPSSINAESFVSENSSLITSNLYFWNGVDYATYNTSLSSGTAGGLGAIPDGNIAVGQAFFVDATGSGNVSFTNAMRGSDSNIFYRKASFPQLRLLVTSDEDKSDLLLTGHHMSSEGVDEYDAKQLEGGSGLSLGSLLYDGTYDIESVPEFSGHEFDLELKTSEAKEITFNITDLIGLNGKHVYLEDREKGIVTDLTQSNYTTYINTGKNNKRFKLTVAEESMDYRAWVNEGEVFVCKGQELLSGTITITGLDGRVLDVSHTRHISNWNAFPSGIYLLTIQNEEERFITKIIKQ